MEVLAVVLTLALPAVVLVGLVLLFQTRARLKKLDTTVAKVYRRQVSDDLVRMADQKQGAASMREYVSDMFGEDDD